MDSPISSLRLRHSDALKFIAGLGIALLIAIAMSSCATTDGQASLDTVAVKTDGTAKGLAVRAEGAVFGIKLVAERLPDNKSITIGGK